MEACAAKPQGRPHRLRQNYRHRYRRPAHGRRARRWRTVMENCAREPEVLDLAELLIKMGAKIEGAGTSTIKVKGVPKLHGAKHRIIPDRIEAGTFIIAGAITGGDLNVTNCDPSPHRSAEQARRSRREGQSQSRIGARARVGDLKAADVTTEEYPGFPTDMQAQYMAIARRPTAPQSSPKTSSRIASCTRRNSCAWAPTSRLKDAALSSAARLRSQRRRRPRLRSACIGFPGTSRPRRRG